MSFSLGFRVRAVEPGGVYEFFGYYTTQEEAEEVAQITLEEYADEYDRVEVIDRFDEVIMSFGDPQWEGATATW